MNKKQRGCKRFLQLKTQFPVNQRNAPTKTAPGELNAALSKAIYKPLGKKIDELSGANTDYRNYTFGQLTEEHGKYGGYAIPALGYAMDAVESSLYVSEHNMLIIYGGFNGKQMKFSTSFKMIRENYGVLTSAKNKLAWFTESVGELTKKISLEGAAYVTVDGASAATTLGIAAIGTAGSVMGGLEIADQVCSIKTKKSKNVSGWCEELGHILGSKIYDIMLATKMNKHMEEENTLKSSAQISLVSNTNPKLKVNSSQERAIQQAVR
ncbi:MAG: hypothetical protein ACXVCP_18805 [Bdellovibrio sp.]